MLTLHRPVDGLNSSILTSIEEPVMPISITVKTHTRTDMVDITPLVQKKISEGATTDGICIVCVPHTTAGVTINEGADPAVCRDIMRKLNELIPHDDSYQHAEGNSDSHIKTSIIGSSVTLPVEEGRLILGTWQKIFFCEFDGPRSRSVYLVSIRK